MHFKAKQGWGKHPRGCARLLTGLWTLFELVGDIVVLFVSRLWMAGVGGLVCEGRGDGDESMVLGVGRWVDCTVYGLQDADMSRLETAYMKSVRLLLYGCYEFRLYLIKN